MSRSQDPDTESLDDKIAKPVFYGAIPLYEGTDARLAKAHGYPSLNLRRENYESDDDFPQDIVGLARVCVLLKRKKQKARPKGTRQDHARTELGFQDPGTGWIPPSRQDSTQSAQSLDGSPLVQFKLYQGEVLPYNPGTRDWVESTQSETPQAPTDDDDVYDQLSPCVEVRGLQECQNR